MVATPAPGLGRPDHRGLDDEHLPEQIAAVLGRHGLPAAAPTVEVVEDSLMLDPERAVRTLTALRAIGLTVAIDDHGTGYSSPAHLYRLPIDEVEFDRSLTSGIADDAAATAIVRHSVRLAHELGSAVLAEGVERPRDLDRLRELDCDAVQGSHTGRPMPVADWTAFLAGLPAIGAGQPRCVQTSARPRSVRWVRSGSDRA